MILATWPRTTRWLWDAEAAWVRGRFSVQGEYLHSWVNEKDREGPHFDGVYASASWFLTGESRPYDLNNGRLHV
jgi:phosphate-selective porin OprO/OprP